MQLTISEATGSAGEALVGACAWPIGRQPTRRREAESSFRETVDNN